MKIWTMDVNWLKEYTIKFACLYLSKYERDKQKTANWSSHIYKMRVKQDWLENSFARISFKEREIVKKLFAIVFPLRLCTCLKKFVSSS